MLDIDNLTPEDMLEISKILGLKNLDVEDVSEIIDILSSPLRWAEAFLHDPNTDKLFKANYVEQQILTAKGPWVVIRVPRRQGKSYSLSVLCLWAMAVHSNYTILILAPEEGHVAEFFDYIRNFLSVNPELACEIKENTKSPHRIKFKNNSVIKGKTTGAASSRNTSGIRGKGGDLIILDEAAYLKDSDFGQILPIVTNDIYKDEVLIYAASTPTADHNRYYTWCTAPDSQWEQIHIPITEIPEITPERLAMIKSLHTEMEWIVEDLAEFPDIGDNVFRNSDIDKAKGRYTYSLDGLADSTKKIIGVDWDKHSCGVTIALVEAIPGTNNVRLIYREEIPRGQYTLTNAVNRIIGLNELVKPDFIYVDRGYGEAQIELLKLYGKENPSSKLHEKVIGIQFGQDVSIQDPITGKEIKKQFKSVMINTISRMLEDGLFQFSDKDSRFDKQLRGYKIVGLSSDRIQTTRKNEHIIDAVGLALYGMHTHFYDRLKFKPATKVVIRPQPIPVKSKRAKEEDKRLFSSKNSVFVDRMFTKGLQRGTLMHKVPGRSRF